MTSDNDILPNASVRIRQAGRNLKSVLRPVDDAAAAAAGGLSSQRAAPRSITGAVCSLLGGLLTTAGLAPVKSSDM